MLRANTPVEWHADLGLWVKREDQACKKPGPQFSKTRGVFAHVAKKVKEGVTLFGALDTYHSQAGHAVARACNLLGARCLVFYPEYKREPGPRAPQRRAVEQGAALFPLKAGRSAILFHQARRETEAKGGYMMPNALKLDESVEETAKEVRGEALSADVVLIPASSATIAAGVISGFEKAGRLGDIEVVVHLGYTRSLDAVRGYLLTKTGVKPEDYNLRIVNEGFAYKDKARIIHDLPFPCNHYYDMKTMDWWLGMARQQYPNKRVLFWNVG
jgi:1-aminocyclopropane-1-carboxylate deaminase/D-cysteine desulfhydrase-like pyridoxal-dependent ACC family enzyme